MLDEQGPALGDGLGDGLSEEDVKGEGGVLGVVTTEVGSDPDDVDVLVSVLAREQLVSHDRPDGLSGGDNNDTIGFRSEHLLPDPGDLRCPVADVAEACLVRISSVPSSLLQPELQSHELGVLPSFEPRVPCLVGPLQVHLDVLAEGRQHQPRHLPHELVVGIVRDGEPGVSPDLIGQPHHELDRNSVPPDLDRRVPRRPVRFHVVLNVASVRSVVHFRPVRPAARLLHVCSRPIHEAEGPVVLDALEVPGVEGEALGPVLESGHDDADVADGVGRVRSLDDEEEAVVEDGRRLNLYFHPPDSSPHALDVRHDRRQDPVAVVGHHVHPSRGMPVQVTDHHRADPLVGLQASGVVVVSQLDRDAGGPREGGEVLRDPVPAGLEHVDERPLG
mmetsp:Transcript_26564/g.87250  ORF Transcript_26564/g.87250 Transcript_26564/m.87250 type:complete len:390 (-) Transcript_26564:1901-3070(-)